MAARFRHAAIIGKYQARGIHPVLEDVAHFLSEQGLDVSFDSETAAGAGMTQYDVLARAQLGTRCDLAVVVGGDGTMLGIARELISLALVVESLERPARFNQTLPDIEKHRPAGRVVTVKNGKLGVSNTPLPLAVHKSDPHAFPERGDAFVIARPARGWHQ